MRSWIRRTIGIVGFLVLIACLSERAGRTGGGIPGGPDGVLEIAGLLFLCALLLYLIFIPSRLD
jgi:hypothetical protein